jgi:hypothetical protein
MILVGRALDENPGATVTLVGLSVSKLTTEEHVQLEFDLGEGDILRPGSDIAQTRGLLEGSVDQVREKFGRDSLSYGMRKRGASDDFRRLAERS